MGILVIALSFMVALFPPQCISGNERGSDGRRGDWREQHCWRIRICESQKAEMPANYLIVGSPAKAIRELSEQELAWKKQGTHEYQVLVTRCKQTLHQVEPLREVEPGRQRLVFDENLRPKQ